MRLNHWTTRQVPSHINFFNLCLLLARERDDDKWRTNEAGVKANDAPQ